MLMLFILNIEMWPWEIWDSHHLLWSMTENGRLWVFSYTTKISLKWMGTFLSWFKQVQVWWCMHTNFNLFSCPVLVNWPFWIKQFKTLFPLLFCMPWISTITFTMVQSNEVNPKNSIIKVTVGDGSIFLPCPIIELSWLTAHSWLMLDGLGLSKIIW